MVAVNATTVAAQLVVRARPKVRRIGRAATRRLLEALRRGGIAQALARHAVATLSSSSRTRSRISSRRLQVRQCPILRICRQGSLHLGHSFIGGGMVAQSSILSGTCAGAPMPGRLKTAAVGRYWPRSWSCCLNSSQPQAINLSRERRKERRSTRARLAAKRSPSSTHTRLFFLPQTITEKICRSQWVNLASSSISPDCIANSKVGVVVRPPVGVVVRPRLHTSLASFN